MIIIDPAQIHLAAALNSEISLADHGCGIGALHAEARKGTRRFGIGIRGGIALCLGADRTVYLDGSEVELHGVLIIGEGFCGQAPDKSAGDHGARNGLSL